MSNNLDIGNWKVQSFYSPKWIWLGYLKEIFFGVY